MHVKLMKLPHRLARRSLLPGALPRLLCDQPPQSLRLLAEEGRSAVAAVCHALEKVRGRGQPGESRVPLPAAAQVVVSEAESSLRDCFAVDYTIRFWHRAPIRVTSQSLQILGRCVLVKLHLSS